jgi:predicted ester cyclase
MVRGAWGIIGSMPWSQLNRRRAFVWSVSSSSGEHPTGCDVSPVGSFFSVHHDVRFAPPGHGGRPSKTLVCDGPGVLTGATAAPNRQSDMHPKALEEVVTVSKDQNIKAQLRGGEIATSRDFDRWGEVFAENVIDHDPADGQVPGVEGIQQYWRSFNASFPDFRLHVDDFLADEDHLTLVYRISGTHQGEYMGHAPTGKRFEVQALQVGRFEGGLMVERWGCTDVHGIFQQLGLS